jgi:thiol-disulfide isomerase/thioredoxin
MKTFQHLLFPFLITILILGCYRTEKPNNKQIIITGKIDNYVTGSDNNLVEIIFNDILDNQVIELIQINENGGFKHITERPFPQDFMLRYGSLVGLYVSPGDSIFIEIDKRLLYSDSLHLNDYDLIKVTGTATKINSDIIKYHKYFNDSVFNWSDEEKTIKENPPEQYSIHIENRTKKYNGLVDKFNRDNLTGSEFQIWVKNDIEYGALNDLMRYRWLYPMYNNIKRDSLGKYQFDIPLKYFAFLDGQKNGNRAAIVSTNYYSFLHEYSMYLKHDNFPPDTLVRLTALSKSKDMVGCYNILKRQIFKSCNGFAQDLILSNLYYQLIKGGFLDIYEKVSKTTPIQEPSLKGIIQKKYVSSKAVFENPQVLENSHLNKISNDIIKPVFDTISYQFKGNILYIDFWAPWCSPCMSEIPSSLKIQKEYEGQDIRFIFLANRCTEQSWKATISEKQITGEHFLLTDDQYKFLVNQFKITGIPHYVLIDKLGHVYKNNAPRPSNDLELKKMIQLMLDD